MLTIQKYYMYVEQLVKKRAWSDAIHPLSRADMNQIKRIRLSLSRM